MVKGEECKLKQGKDAAFKQIKIEKTVQAVKGLRQLIVQTIEIKNNIYKYNCSSAIQVKQ